MLPSVIPETFRMRLNQDDFFEQTKDLSFDERRKVWSNIMTKATSLGLTIEQCTDTRDFIFRKEALK